MATIDEIFENMPAEASVTYEELVIDAESREILVPDAEAIFGVESDTKSERKHFRCPRYVGNGLDLASCFLRVNFRNANGEVDSYLIEDTAIDGEYITFSWELSKKVTAYKGAVKFNVCAIMGAGLPEWNTTLAEGIVLEGLEPDSSTVEAETADVIAQLLATVAAQTAAVEAVGAAQRAEVQKVGENTTEEAKAAVEAKGEAVRASIPEDYSTLSATVDKLTRDRAAAIVCEAEGETIQVTDSSADPLVGLRIFGKSTQNGTPTPDAPVEIVSAKAPTVTVCGKNLLPLDAVFTFVQSVTLSVNIPAGTYLLSYSGESHDGADVATVRFRTNDVWCQFDETKEKVVTLEKDESTLFFYSNGTSYNNSAGIGATINHLMLSVEGGGYEPYRGGTLTLSTPTSLPGIPVSSGGNYTDANGQQWIADEIDLERGVYVQRVRNLVFTGDETLDNTWYPVAIYHIHSPAPHINLTHNSVRSSHFGGVSCGNTLGTSIAFGNLDKLGFESSDALIAFFAAQYAQNNTVMVQYAVAAPIETPLSTEEIEAFKALLANKPTTTVLNDAGAWMALEYAADPKTYIDNKIAALLAANN